MPFRIFQEKEPELLKVLESSAEQQSSFKILLDGFGCFSPNVIFVKVQDHNPVLAFYRKLQEELKNIISQETASAIHPHMTIATRDLQKDHFRAAWEVFKDREFKAEFVAVSVFLLKHNGKTWDVLKEQFFKT